MQNLLQCHCGGPRHRDRLRPLRCIAQEFVQVRDELGNVVIRKSMALATFSEHLRSIERAAGTVQTVVREERRGIGQECEDV
jgi:hypothetical protein